MSAIPGVGQNIQAAQQAQQTSSMDVNGAVNANKMVKVAIQSQKADIAGSRIGRAFDMHT